MAPELYPRLLGEAWWTLPESIRRAHFYGSPLRLGGSLHLQPGESRWARLLQRIFGLPRQAGVVPATLEIARGDAGEVWSRQIGTWRLRSRQSYSNGRLQEAVGPLVFEFEVSTDGRCLRYKQVGLRIQLLGLSIPIPRVAAPSVEAEERVADMPYLTEVSVRLAAPGAALLLAYRGRLKLEG